jgi:hypothetical protein
MCPSWSGSAAKGVAGGNVLRMTDPIELLVPADGFGTRRVVMPPVR